MDTEETRRWHRRRSANARVTGSVTGGDMAGTGEDSACAICTAPSTIARPPGHLSARSSLLLINSRPTNRSPLIRLEGSHCAQLQASAPRPIMPALPSSTPPAVTRLFRLLKQSIGAQEARNELRWMQEHLNQISMPSPGSADIETMLQRRLNREPLQYILGRSDRISTSHAHKLPRRLTNKSGQAPNHSDRSISSRVRPCSSPGQKRKTGRYDCPSVYCPVGTNRRSRYSTSARVRAVSPFSSATCCPKALSARPPSTSPRPRSSSRGTTRRSAGSPSPPRRLRARTFRIVATRSARSWATSATPRSWRNADCDHPTTS